MIDPRSIRLKYADPAYAPDWAPKDCPTWPGDSPSPDFRAWIAERVVELKARVRADQFAAMQNLPPEEAEALVTAMSDYLSQPAMHTLAIRFEDAKLALSKGPDDVVPYEAIAKKLARDAEKRAAGKARRGPTKLEQADIIETPEAKAAHDIWLIRKVILPRFWEQGRSAKPHLRHLEIATVAAQPYGCDPRKAERYYLDNGLASK